MTADGIASAAARRARRPSIASLIPVVTLLTVVACAIFAGVLSSSDPLAQDPTLRLLAPSSGHPAGTDEFGRDVMARLLYGARVSIVVGVSAVALAATVGVFLGIVLAYAGSWIDELGMRVMDIVIAFPGMVLAMALVAVAGSSMVSLILVIAVVQTPVFVRLARASTLSLVNSEFILSSIVMGAGPGRVVFAHILPNIVAPIVTMAGLALADAILIEASLGFLGLGVQPPDPSWGNIMAAGRNFILVGAWWLLVFPGIAMFMTIASINVISDNVRDRLDPRWLGDDDLGEAQA